MTPSSSMNTENDMNEYQEIIERDFGVIDREDALIGGGSANIYEELGI